MKRLAYWSCWYFYLLCVLCPSFSCSSKREAYIIVGFLHSLWKLLWNQQSWCTQQSLLEVAVLISQCSVSSSKSPQFKQNLYQRCSTIHPALVEDLVAIRSYWHDLLNINKTYLTTLHYDRLSVKISVFDFTVFFIRIVIG